jgi:hypothetical protein
VCHQPIFDGALMAQNELLHHHQAPTHGVMVEQTTITPSCDGASMAQWRLAALDGSRCQLEKIATRDSHSSCPL